MFCVLCIVFVVLFALLTFAIDAVELGFDIVFCVLCIVFVVLFALLTFAIDAVELGFDIVFCVLCIVFVVLCARKGLHDDPINSVDNDDDCTDGGSSINRKDVCCHLIPQNSENMPP